MVAKEKEKYKEITKEIVEEMKRLEEEMAWHGMAWHGMAWHGMAIKCSGSRNTRQCETADLTELLARQRRKNTVLL
jgi:uncharacterized protein involved in copper resistance